MKKALRLLAFVMCIVMTFCTITQTVFAVEVNDKPDEISQIEDAVTEAYVLGENQSAKEQSPNSYLGTNASVVETKTIDEYPEAICKKENEHIRRLDYKEDLNTIIYANADGTETMYMFNTNVKYIDEKGETKDKSTKISMLEKGYTNLDNDIRVVFPTDINSGITLIYKNITILMQPENVSKEASCAKIESLFIPNEDKRERVVYNDVFASTDLLYVPTFDGFKEDIVINEYNGINEYVFTVSIDNATINGNQIYCDDLQIGSIGNVYVIDSKGDVTLGKLTTEETKDGEYRIIIIIENEYLKDAAYPVYIDPSITINSYSSGPKLIEDAPVYSENSNASGGNSYNYCGYVSSSLGYGRVLYRLIGLTSNYTYNQISASQINSVILHLREASGKSGSATVTARPFLETWTESTVKYSNVNINNYNSSGTYAASKTYSSSPKWWEFEIKETVKAWKNGTFTASYGMILINNNESSSTYYRNFLSTEYTNSSYYPYITMDYNTSNSINYTEIFIPQNTTFQLSVTTNPSGLSCSWSSMQPSIATVSSTGLVTGLSIGEAYILCNPANSSTLSCKVTVCSDSMYISPGIATINSGEQATLTAHTNPPNLPVSWICENASAVTVNNGVVTGVNYGTEYVKAYFNFTNGYSMYDTCDIYVRIPEGVYRIKNRGSSKYLTADIGYNDGSDVKQYSLRSSGTDSLTQLWYLEYHGNCRYTLRPFINQEMCLFVDNGDVCLKRNPYNTPSAYSLWQFTSHGISRYFKRMGSNNSTLSIPNSTNNSGASVVISDYSSSNNYNAWTLEEVTSPPNGILFYNTNNNSLLSGNVEIYYFDTKTLLELGIAAVPYYPSTSYNNSVTWTSNDVSVAMVDNTNGCIEGVSHGSTQIHATKSINGLSISESYNLTVKKYILRVGQSVDTYQAGCDFGVRKSMIYANAFQYGLSTVDPNIELESTYHYNLEMCLGATKNDFRNDNINSGLYADSNDFMIYIGHGIAADRPSNVSNGNSNRGNYLHYNFDVYENAHSCSLVTCNCFGNDQTNLYTDEALFGGSNSRLRWVLLYTCNFLNTNNYVSESDLKGMMNGAHCVMGYETQSILCLDFINSLVSALNNNNRIIDSFFIAGDQGEELQGSYHHVQVAMYVEDTRNDTIYTSPQDISYSTNDVLIIKNDINDSIIWEDIYANQ